MRVPLFGLYSMSWKRLCLVNFRFSAIRCINGQIKYMRKAIKTCTWNMGVLRKCQSGPLFYSQVINMESDWYYVLCILLKDVYRIHNRWLSSWRLWINNLGTESFSWALVKRRINIKYLSIVQTHILFWGTHSLLAIYLAFFCYFWHGSLIMLKNKLNRESNLFSFQVKSTEI